MKNNKGFRMFSAIIRLCLLMVLVMVVTLMLEKRKNRKNCEDFAILNVENVTFEKVEKIQDELPYVLGGYYTDIQARVKVPEVSREQEAVAVVVNFAVTGQISSSAQLLRDDLDGCLMSSGLMYALFGTDCEFGQTFTYGERRYIVRGSIPSSQKFFVVQYCKYDGKDVVVDKLMLDISGELYRGQYLQKLSGTYNLGTDSGLCYATDYTFFFGRNFLPAKWSDGSYYRGLWGKILQMMERRLYENKDIFEICYYQFLVEKTKYVCWCVVIVSVFAVFGRRMSHEQIELYEDDKELCGK